MGLSAASGLLHRTHRAGAAEGTAGAGGGTDAGPNELRGGRDASASGGAGVAGMYACV